MKLLVNRLNGTKKIHYLLLGAALTCQISGCGFLERNTIGLLADSEQPKELEEPINQEELANAPASVAIDKLDPKEPGTKGANPQFGKIELTWAVPDEQVDGYVIRYGLEKSNLDHEIQLTSSELEKVPDGRSREIYRYVLSSVPTDKTVFVAIAARRGTEITPLSEIREILP